MGSLITTLLSFILVIGILIAVHEFGHFWVARRSGVKVLRFSIGFGKALWQTTGKQDGTEYVLAAIPLGGYVKMLDEREGPVAEEERHRAFNRQSLTTRAAIVIAGPLFNLVFAVLVFWVVMVTGDLGVRPVIAEVEADSLAEQAGFAPGDELLSAAGRDTSSWEEFIYALLAAAGDADELLVEVRESGGMRMSRSIPNQNLVEYLEAKNPLDNIGIKPGPLLPAIIGELVAGEAAERAGLQAGDRVVAANGEPISGWSALVAYVQARPGEELELEVERAGSRLLTQLTLGRTQGNQGEVGRIGAGVQVPDGFFERYRVVVRKGPFEAVGAAIGKTWDMSALMLEMMWRMITGEASVEKNLGSVISIAKAAGQSAEYGIAPFLKFLAQISIVLAVMNLLPIPMLDGGHLFFYLIEAVRGKPLSDAVQEQFNRVGLALLMGLITLALYLDVIRLLG